MAKRDNETLYYIEIPDDLKLYIALDDAKRVAAVYEIGDPDVPDGWEPQTMQFERDFIRRVVLVDPWWGEELDRLYMAMELRSAFRGKRPGDVVPVTKEQHEALCNVVRKPSRGYMTALVLHFGDWFRACTDAANRPPETAANGRADVERAVTA
jgi:hypothetical protein